MVIIALVVKEQHYLPLSWQVCLELFVESKSFNFKILLKLVRLGLRFSKSDSLRLQLLFYR
jgi:hypothetical protein